MSAGHGLPFEGGGQAVNPANMHRIVFDHLTKLFPQNEWIIGEKSQDGKNGFVNGAQGGVRPFWHWEQRSKRAQAVKAVITLACALASTFQRRPT